MTHQSFRPVAAEYEVSWNRSGHDDLELSRRVAIQDRRRVAARRFGTVGSPRHFAGVPVQRDDERVQVLIADENDLIAGDDGRGAHAIDVLERLERVLPPLLPVEVVREKAIVREEDVDALLVDRGTRRRGVVPIVDFRDPRPRRLATPENLPRLSVEAIGEQLVVLERGQKDPLFRKNRRRVPRRKLRFPDHVLRRAEPERESLLGSIDSRPIGAPEAGPLRGHRGGGESGDESDGANCQTHETMLLPNSTAHLTLAGISWHWAGIL